MTRFTWAVCPVSQCWPTRLPSGRSPSAKDSRVASRTSESMESVPRSQPSSKTTILQVRPVFYSLIIYAHAIIASKYWIGIYSSLNKFSNIRISVGISLGCLMQNSLNPCDPNPCKNYGRCEPTLAAFKCHCEMTGYEGETCNIGSFSCVTFEETIVLFLQSPPQSNLTESSSTSTFCPRRSFLKLNTCSSDSK